MINEYYPSFPHNKVNSKLDVFLKTKHFRIDALFDKVRGGVAQKKLS